MSIFSDRPYFKPLSYDWAWKAYELQQSMHWVPSEVPLAEDVRDWNHNLSPAEKNLLTQIFRFFTQGDIDVSEGYVSKYLPMFRLPELRMMLLSFANMEAVHIHAYSLLLEEVGMPEVEYSAFRSFKEMADKHDFVTEGAAELVKGFSPEQKTAFDIAIFSAFTEGLQLFSSFAILLNFTRFGKMKGMGQIVTWSIRDESLHVQSMIKVYHAILDEHPKLRTRTFRERLRDICVNMVNLEYKFIDLAFEQGGIEGLTAEDVKAYVRYIADRRMVQLGEEPVFDATTHPLDWLGAILNGVEHANFFETRSTEYAKARLSGRWTGDVWGSLGKSVESVLPQFLGEDLSTQ